MRCVCSSKSRGLMAPSSQYGSPFCALSIFLSNQYFLSLMSKQLKMAAVCLLHVVPKYKLLAPRVTNFWTSTWPFLVHTSLLCTAHDLCSLCNSVHILNKLIYLLFRDICSNDFRKLTNIFKKSYGDIQGVREACYEPKPLAPSGTLFTNTTLWFSFAGKSENVSVFKSQAVTVVL